MKFGDSFLLLLLLCVLFIFVFFRLIEFISWGFSCYIATCKCFTMTFFALMILTQSNETRRKCMLDVCFRRMNCVSSSDTKICGNVLYKNIEINIQTIFSPNRLLHIFTFELCAKSSDSVLRNCTCKWWMIFNGWQTQQFRDNWTNIQMKIAFN